MKNKKKKMKLQHMPKIKELTNLYIPEMTWLRNLSKLEKTSHIINLNLFRIQSNI